MAELLTDPDQIMEAFSKVSPMAADLMRFTCFSAGISDNAVVFEIIQFGADEVNQELAALLNASDENGQDAALLTVLKSLEAAGLIEINVEHRKYSTNQQIREIIIERDDT